MVDKKLLARNFSRYAALYDKHAEIQRIAADLLSAELPSGAVGRILEIGCGTGIYTAILKERFARSRIKAIDISARAVEIAAAKIEGVDFAVCDAESARFAGAYDLITSNSVFQWFGDLDATMKSYKAALSEDGTLLFSAFGPETFRELDICLSGALKGRSINSRRFADRPGLKELLERHFRKARVKEMVIRLEYGSLMELLDTIRYTGTRGDGVQGDVVWRRSLLRGIEEAYRKRYGRIVASYQIFLCRASG
jgi:malonyl-CoA O-methyltransferase